MATVTLVFNVDSVTSTGVTFAPAAGLSGTGPYTTNTGALAAGFVLGTLTVAPAGWSGGVSATVSGVAGATVTITPVSGQTNEFTIATGQAWAVANGYNVVVVSTP